MTSICSFRYKIVYWTECNKCNAGDNHVARPGKVVDQAEPHRKETYSVKWNADDFQRVGGYVIYDRYKIRLCVLYLDLVGHEMCIVNMQTCS